MEHPDPDVDEANPIGEADLLLSTEPLADDFEEDAIHDTLIEMDLVSVSLWARYDDDFELPLWAVSPAPMWLSPFPDEFSGDPMEPISQELIDGVASMVDEDVGGWGHVPEDILESLSDLETMLLNEIGQSFVELDSSSPALIISWCVERSEYGDTETVEG
jgi:hypothetical protein